MTRAKWYSPQLSREIVSRLYFKAKAEEIPMTVLANRIMEKALDRAQMVERPRDNGSDLGGLPKTLAGSDGPL